LNYILKQNKEKDVISKCFQVISVISNRNELDFKTAKQVPIHQTPQEEGAWYEVYRLQIVRDLSDSFTFWINRRRINCGYYLASNYVTGREVLCFHGDKVSRRGLMGCDAVQ
jgi:hypothetical protein